MYQKNYSILDKKRIRELQNIDISKVTTHLSVSKGVACTLLLRNNWSTNSVFHQWFCDEEKVFESLGLLLPEQESLKPPNNLCKICFEDIEIENMLSGTCGHPFCTNCWKSYIAISINSEGPGCLELRCPEPECKANPGLEFIDLLASNEDKDKYYHYLLRSYVEGSQKRKWCPSPGCDLAVQINSEELKNYDVVCDCSYEFCWNCLEERHYPVDCKIVDKWMKMINSEADNNDNWIRAFTKPCPKCRKKIEKHIGCYHMTCPSPCGQQFCWGCLKPWKFFHFCDKSDQRKDKEINLKSTRESLKRYARHYERWAWNHKSMETALDNLCQAKQNYKLPFVIEGFEQIVESRRVLKWSFAYGYYMPLTEKRRIVYLRFLQEEAEAALERLQHYAEKEAVKYVNADSSSKTFMAFRANLVHLMGVARNNIEKLVRALENDVSETETFSFSGVALKTATYMFMLLGSYCIVRVLEVF